MGAPLDYARPGDFPTPLPDAPPVAVHLLAVTGRIQQLVNEHGLRAVARELGIAHSGLSRILTGQIWPSSATISAIEHAYDTTIWR